MRKFIIPKTTQESEFQHSRRLSIHRCDADGFKVQDVGAVENRFLSYFRYISFLAAMLVVGQLFAEDQKIYPVVVLGGGVGSLTSSLYLSRAGITPLVIEGASRGGAIAQSPKVQNWPGEVEISGMGLVEKIRDQAQFNGVQFLTEEVISVDFQKRPFTIVTRDLFNPEKTRVLKTNAAIIALGSRPNLLAVPGEQEYWTRGVYNCAVCDGALYRNQTVAIVGGGDAAVLEAEHLSNIAKKVFILVRKDKFRAFEERRLQELLVRPNVEVLYTTTVKEIQGIEEKVSQLIIVREGKEQILAVDALFLAIGSKPNSQLFAGQLEMDEQGYLLLKKDQETSIPGVFAIGDIVDPVYKQAIIAAGQGAIAACQAVQTVGNKNNAISTSSEASISKGDVTEITSLTHFQRELKDARTPIFVDFYANWCGPCKLLSPMFQTWAEDYAGKIKFLKVNVDQFEELAYSYQVTGMPTLLVLTNEGRLVDKKVGTQSIVQYVRSLDLKALNEKK
jgi:thioredoxin reductase (NADPH)